MKLSNCFSNKTAFEKSSANKIVALVLTILIATSLVLILLGFLSYLPLYTSWIGMAAFVLSLVASVSLLCRKSKEKPIDLKDPVPVTVPTIHIEKTEREILFEAMKKGDFNEVIALLKQNSVAYKKEIVQIIDDAFENQVDEKNLKLLFRFNACTDISKFPDYVPNLGHKIELFSEIYCLADALSLSHFVAAYGDIEAASFLYQHGKLDLTLDSNGRTPLEHAVLNKDIPFIKAVLFLCNGALNNEIGGTLLHLAVRHASSSNSNCDVIKALVKPSELDRIKGVPIDFPDLDGRTALHKSALSKNTKAFLTLFYLGADLSKKDMDGKTPYVYMIEQCKEIESIALPLHTFQWRTQDKWSFLNWELNLNLTVINSFKQNFPTRGSAFLALAASINDNDAVRELLKLGVPPNIQGEDGRTSLHYAAEKGHVDIIKLLLEAGALNLSDHKGQMPMDVAGPQALRTLMQYTMDRIEKDPNVGYLLKRLLFFATTRLPESESINLVDRLIKLGADINEKDLKTDLTPVHLAANTNRAKLVRFFAKHGANLNLKCVKGFTPLIYAEKRGHEEAALALLEEGADPNLGYSIDATFYIFYETEGEGGIAGANINFLFFSPLQLACQNCLLDTATYLLNLDRIDLKKTDLFGRFFFQFIDLNDQRWLELALVLSDKTKIKILDEFGVKSCLESESSDLLLPMIHPFLLSLAASQPDFEKLIEKSLHSLTGFNLLWVIQTWQITQSPEKLFQILSASPPFFIKAFPYLSIEKQKSFAKEFQLLIFKGLEEYDSKIAPQFRQLQDRMASSQLVSVEDKKEFSMIRGKVERMMLICRSCIEGDVKNILDTEFKEQIGVYYKALEKNRNEIVSLLKELKGKSTQSVNTEDLELDIFSALYDFGFTHEDDYLVKLGVTSKDIYKRGLSEAKDLKILGLSNTLGLLIQNVLIAVTLKNQADRNRGLNAILEWHNEEIAELNKLEILLKQRYEDIQVVSKFIEKLKSCENICKNIEDDNFDVNGLKSFLNDLYEWDRARKIFCLKAYLNQPDMETVSEKILNGSSLSEYASSKKEGGTFYYQLKDATK